MFVSKMVSTANCSSFHGLVDDFQKWRLLDFPEYATTADVHMYNNKLESLTLTKAEERKEKCEGYLNRLQETQRESLSVIDKASFDVLHDHLKTYIDGYRWRHYSLCNPISFLESIHIDYESFMIDVTSFKNESDFYNYNERLQGFPGQIDEQIILMKEAIAHKTTLHRVSVERVPGQLAELIKKDMENHPFCEPIRKHINVVEDASKQKEIKEMLESTIKDSLTPAFIKLQEFMECEYLPATRRQEGVGSLQDGQEFYKACLKWHLSCDLSPDDVHQQGLLEVARLRECMQDVMNKVNFDGSLAEFFEKLKADKSFYHKSAEDLLVEYREMIAKRINPKLSHLFNKLPAIDCDVRAMPFDGPGGQYVQAAEDGSRPGVFQVNLMHPTTIARFGMMVLSLHEVNPGHHMQISMALQLALPMFRRKLDYRRLCAAPLAFPIYTAYIEGWALYAEDLGLDMDVYDTPYEVFGKLSEEMFRACRLVVDTGLHYFGWSKEKAMDYMNSNCFMAPNEVENEICRYITWPGQACAYKIGQLKIKELRKLAEKELGDRFDVKAFHDVILDMSAVPLHLLETLVKDWIVEQRSV